MESTRAALDYLQSLHDEFNGDWLLAIAAYLLTGLAQVRPEERAVVRRFGQVVARPGPGLWVGLPWGIDRVDRVPVRTVRQLRNPGNEDAVYVAVGGKGGYVGRDGRVPEDETGPRARPISA